MFIVNTDKLELRLSSLDRSKIIVYTERLKTVTINEKKVTVTEYKEIGYIPFIPTGN